MKPEVSRLLDEGIDRYLRISRGNGREENQEENQDGYHVAVFLPRRIAFTIGPEFLIVVLACARRDFAADTVIV